MTAPVTCYKSKYIYLPAGVRSWFVPAPHAVQPGLRQDVRLQLRLPGGEVRPYAAPIAVYDTKKGRAWVLCHVASAMRLMGVRRGATVDLRITRVHGSGGGQGAQVVLELAGGAAGAPQSPPAGAVSAQGQAAALHYTGPAAAAAAAAGPSSGRPADVILRLCSWGAAISAPNVRQLWPHALRARPTAERGLKVHLHTQTPAAAATAAEGPSAPSRSEAGLRRHTLHLGAWAHTHRLLGLEGVAASLGLQVGGYFRITRLGAAQGVGAGGDGEETEAGQAVLLAQCCTPQQLAELPSPRVRRRISGRGSGSDGGSSHEDDSSEDTRSFGSSSGDIENSGSRGRSSSSGASPSASGRGEESSDGDSDSCCRGSSGVAGCSDGEEGEEGSSGQEGGSEEEGGSGEEGGNSDSDDDLPLVKRRGAPTPQPAQVHVARWSGGYVYPKVAAVRALWPHAQPGGVYTVQLQTAGAAGAGGEPVQHKARLQRVQVPPRWQLQGGRTLMQALGLRPSSKGLVQLSALRGGAVLVERWEGPGARLGAQAGGQAGTSDPAGRHRCLFHRGSAFPRSTAVADLLPGGQPGLAVVVQLHSAPSGKGDGAGAGLSGSRIPPAFTLTLRRDPTRWRLTGAGPLQRALGVADGGWAWLSRLGDGSLLAEGMPEGAAEGAGPGGRAQVQPAGHVTGGDSRRHVGSRQGAVCESSGDGSSDGDEEGSISGSESDASGDSEESASKLSLAAIGAARCAATPQPLPQPAAAIAGSGAAAAPGARGYVARCYANGTVTVPAAAVHELWPRAEAQRVDTPGRRVQLEVELWAAAGAGGGAGGGQGPRRSALVRHTLQLVRDTSGWRFNGAGQVARAVGSADPGAGGSPGVPLLFRVFRHADGRVLAGPVGAADVQAAPVTAAAEARQGPLLLTCYRHYITVPVRTLRALWPEAAGRGGAVGQGSGAGTGSGICSGSRVPLYTAVGDVACGGDGSLVPVAGLQAHSPLLLHNASTGSWQLSGCAAIARAVGVAGVGGGVSLEVVRLPDRRLLVRRAERGAGGEGVQPAQGQKQGGQAVALPGQVGRAAGLEGEESDSEDQEEGKADGDDGGRGFNLAQEMDEQGEDMGVQVERQRQAPAAQRVDRNARNADSAGRHGCRFNRGSLFIRTAATAALLPGRQHDSQVVVHIRAAGAAPADAAAGAAAGPSDGRQRSAPQPLQAHTLTLRRDPKRLRLSGAGPLQRALGVAEGGRAWLSRLPGGELLAEAQGEVVEVQRCRPDGGQPRALPGLGDGQGGRQHAGNGARERHGGDSSTTTNSGGSGSSSSNGDSDGDSGGDSGASDASQEAVSHEAPAGRALTPPPQRPPAAVATCAQGHTLRYANGAIFVPAAAVRELWPQAEATRVDTPGRRVELEVTLWADAGGGGGAGGGRAAGGQGPHRPALVRHTVQLVRDNTVRSWRLKGAGQVARAVGSVDPGASGSPGAPLLFRVSRHADGRAVAAPVGGQRGQLQLQLQRVQAVALRGQVGHNAGSDGEEGDMEDKEEGGADGEDGGRGVNLAQEMDEQGEDMGGQAQRLRQAPAAQGVDRSARTAGSAGRHGCRFNRGSLFVRTAAVAALLPGRQPDSQVVVRTRAAGAAHEAAAGPPGGRPRSAPQPLQAHTLTLRRDAAIGWRLSGSGSLQRALGVAEGGRVWLSRLGDGSLLAEGKTMELGGDGPLLLRLYAQNISVPIRTLRALWPEAEEGGRAGSRRGGGDSSGAGAGGGLRVRLHTAVEPSGPPGAGGAGPSAGPSARQPQLQLQRHELRLAFNGSSGSWRLTGSGAIARAAGIPAGPGAGVPLEVVRLPDGRLLVRRAVVAGGGGGGQQAQGQRQLQRGQAQGAQPAVEKEGDQEEVLGARGLEGREQEEEGEEEEQEKEEEQQVQEEGQQGREQEDSGSEQDEGAERDKDADMEAGAQEEGAAEHGPGVGPPDPQLPCPPPARLGPAPCASTRSRPRPCDTDSGADSDSSTGSAGRGADSEAGNGHSRPAGGVPALKRQRVGPGAQQQEQRLPAPRPSSSVAGRPTAAAGVVAGGGPGHRAGPRAPAAQGGVSGGAGGAGVDVQVGEREATRAVPLELVPRQAQEQGAVRRRPGGGWQPVGLLTPKRLCGPGPGAAGVTGGRAASAPLPAPAAAAADTAAVAAPPAGAGVAVAVSRQRQGPPAPPRPAATHTAAAGPPCPAHLPVSSLSPGHLLGAVPPSVGLPPLQPGELRVCGLTYHPVRARAERQAMADWEAGLGPEGLAGADPAGQQIGLGAPLCAALVRRHRLLPQVLADRLAKLLGLAADWAAPLPSGPLELPGVEAAAEAGGGRCRGGMRLRAVRAIRRSHPVGVVGGYVLPSAAAEELVCRGFQRCGPGAAAELEARAGGVEDRANAWRMLARSHLLPLQGLGAGGEGGAVLWMLGYGNLGALVNDPRANPRAWEEGNDVEAQGQGQEQGEGQGQEDGRLHPGANCAVSAERRRRQQGTCVGSS